MAWESPRTWVAGEVVTAAIMNAAIRDNLLVLGGTAGVTWTDFSPTISQSAAVTTTVTYARYQLQGKRANVQLKLVAASAGTGSNAIQINAIPAAIQPARTGNTCVLGFAVYVDGGVGYMIVGVYANAATTWRFLRDGENVDFGVAGPTVANTDEIYIVATYEVA